MRRFLLSMAGAVLVTAAAVVPAAHAEPSVTDGKCSDATSITVVIDFQELGGDTIVKCVSGLAEGVKASKVMTAAGFTTQGTSHDGDSFVCRINDRPSAAEEIPVAGMPGYTETCVKTPPAKAYWSLWHSTNGGTWTYSQLGFKSLKVPTGGYLGWSFSLNRSKDTNPTPRVTPWHETAKPTPPPTTKPAPTPTSTKSSKAPSGGTSTKPGATSKPGTTKKPASSASTTTPAKPGASRPSQASKPPAARPTSPGRAPRPVGPPPRNPSAGPTAAPSQPAASPSATSSSEPSAASPAPSDMPASASPNPDGTASAYDSVSPAPAVQAEIADGGFPVGTVGGIAAVGALATAAGTLWFRRRQG